VSAKGDPVGYIDWARLTAVEAHRYLDYIRSWPVTLQGSTVLLHLGASEGDLALLVAEGPPGMELLERLQSTHPSDPAITGPLWIRDGGVRCMVVQQGSRPFSSCELGEHLRLVAHGSVAIPPSVEGNLLLSWRRGREPNLCEVTELPSWLGEAAEKVRRDNARAQVEGGEWFAALYRDKAGSVRNTFANTCSILRNAEQYATLRFNGMSAAIEYRGADLSDANLGAIREEIEREYGFSPGVEPLGLALTTVASEREYHPVREYLGRLQWDGKKRLATLAQRVLGAQYEIEGLMLRRWAISAVARAYQPGCKVDTVLVLQGGQGWRKSTFFSAMVGQWFSDSHIDLSNKDAYMQLARVWVLEWAEIERVTARKGSDEVKSFLSSPCDTYRPPYGRAVVQRKRSSVIVGTTNEDEYLHDPTGARRFWPIRVCARVDVETIEAERDQLWAEAAAAYHAREQWWLTDDEVEQQRLAVEQVRVADAWEPAIERWVEETTEVITTARILQDACRVELARITNRESVRIAGIMRRLGYVQRVQRVQGANTRVWSR
jgi:hypothetical protein